MSGGMRTARPGRGESGKGLEDAGGPVTGNVRRRGRATGSHRGAAAAPSAFLTRRDAVLRVLMEAYRRDLGPGWLDAR